jgi:DNA-binding NarL/FixJ family response regulator
MDSKPSTNLPSASRTRGTPFRRFKDPTALTERESLVAKHLLTGLADVRIARLLDVKIDTVRSRIYAMRSKLDAYSRANLIQILNAMQLP